MSAAISSWGWPQWLAVAMLVGRIVLTVRDMGLEPSGAPVSDRHTAAFTASLFWIVVLISGGFWS